MESPVVIDKPPEYHGSERGFPFDEEEGSGAWSELASRHPDIAARLRQRPATWARKRRPSSQDATEDFGDRFGGFDRFPFDDIPPEFREHFPTHWNRRFSARDEPESQAPAPPQPQSPHHQTTATQTEENPGSSAATQETHLPQYGLRNTVDLGQKSPADPSLVDAEERNQRSMSAPPDSYTVDQSNLPKMSAHNHQEQAHHPPHPEHPQQPSNVRHIPIFVEGRDEPVINKSTDHGSHFGETKPSYASSPPQQPHIDREQYFADEPVFHAPPNFSRSFGTPFNKGFRQGPQPFVQQKVYPQTAFARGTSPQRSQSPKPQMPADEHYVKVPVQHEPPRPQPRPTPHQPPPAHQQAPPQHPQAPPQHQQAPPPHQQSPPKQQTPPPQQQIPSNDPITQILSIQTDVLNLMTDVENFTGSKKDKKYLFLDEMLTRNLIKLDNIETDGKENIRQARKEAIKCIQKCIAVLETKAEKGGSTPQPQDVEMNENTEGKEDQQPVTENGVEVEMKEPSNETETQAAPLTEESKSEPQAQEQTSETAEVKATAQPETADTRPEDSKPAEQNAESTEEKKDQESVDKKTTPKKGTKNVKKRDKSKDKKETKDSNKEQTVEEQKENVIQVDDKGDKTNSQAMEVDGAASQ